MEKEVLTKIHVHDKDEKYCDVDCRFLDHDDYQCDLFRTFVDEDENSTEMDVIYIRCKECIQATDNFDKASN